MFAGTRPRASPLPFSPDTPPDPPRPPVSRSPWFWLAILIGVSAALVYFLEDQFPGTLANPENQLPLVYKLLWLALLVPALVLGWRSRPKTSLRNGAIWLLIFAGLTALMTFREDAFYIAGRVLGGAAPAAGIVTEDGGVRFTRGADGHFVIRAEVNGKRVMFLLDTGATDIVLTPHDAERVGFDPASLAYDRVVATANGLSTAAPIRLENLVVGPIALGPLPASVNRAEMSHSLLGMEFLNRLSAWRVEGDLLTLMP